MSDDSRLARLRRDIENFLPRAKNHVREYLDALDYLSKNARETDADFLQGCFAEIQRGEYSNRDVIVRWAQDLGMKRDVVS